MKHIAQLATLLALSVTAACGGVASDDTGNEPAEPDNPADPADPADPDDPADPADPVAKFPSSCDDIDNGAIVPDGNYTLYVGNDPVKPYKARCRDNEEYLILARTTSNENYSELASMSTAGVPAILRTRFTHLRIDPQTLQVDVADPTFATNLGQVSIGGITFRSMIVGSAMACHPNVGASGNLDLRGTPFSVDSEWKTSGLGFVAEHKLLSDNQVVTMKVVQGDCIWVSLAGGPDDPRNVSDSAWSLQLAYTK